ncbi:hypothetical protein CONPUDRAFT_110232 [Coniophora puteana RWD-64-598 SS2]|uniref:Membrane insertase YidC/Oxa/ALB C-terminal domain-containing protein n=1 Tax=Coniophora puteana (strain RWD-64-598) TaxID=741705 RepID=A0A5M3MBN1_CONPW|nr:uncharacterized protein CONPUDRAFT_110232 [Coniophora puteana RWD-64-598 SS2]EIW76642.1 hypothetical protein CONPUDRAFT_110232 [Coniophora puteana RWD-64-598 SS2]
MATVARISGRRLMLGLHGQRSQRAALHLSNSSRPRVASAALLLTPGTSRNFWSSKSSTPVSEAQPVAAELPSDALTTSESISAAAAAPPTPPNQPADLASSATDLTSAADLAGSPSELAEAASNSADLVSAASAIPPLQYGDFAAMGLANWWPSGIIAWSHELFQVSTGLPWFWTLVAGGLFWRALLFPVMIKQLRNTARIAPFQGELAKMRERMDRARASQNRMELQSAAMASREVYSRAGVKVGPMFLVPLINIPITLGTFFASKNMAQLPVPQLQDSGVEFLANLTIPDPTFMLPLAVVALGNIQIMLSKKDMNLDQSPHMGHIMNVFQVMSVAMVPFMATLPAGVWVTGLSGLTFTAIQSAVLRRPAVRKALDIAPLPKSSAKWPTLVDTLHAARNFVSGASQQAAAQSRRK